MEWLNFPWLISCLSLPPSRPARLLPRLSSASRGAAVPSSVSAASSPVLLKHRPPSSHSQRRLSSLRAILPESPAHGDSSVDPQPRRPIYRLRVRRRRLLLLPPFLSFVVCRRRRKPTGRMLPTYHGDSRFLLGACFLSKLPTLRQMKVSLVCSANPNNHRSRNLDITRQQKVGSARRKSKSYQEKDDSENIYDFDTDIMSSRNGPPISLTSNSRPQATSVPGEREKEIVELFKRVQSQLRARGKGRDEKKPEPTKAQGERGSVDSLLNLLRKHSVDQRRKSSDEKEQSVDQTRRSNESGNKQNSSIFIKNDTQEEQKKPQPAAFKRPSSNFRRRSPVPGVKFQLVTSVDAERATNNINDAVEETKATLENKVAADEPDSLSTYQPDSVIPPENLYLGDVGLISDDETGASDTDEPNGEYDEPSLQIPNVPIADESCDMSLEPSTGSSDLSSLKVTELRELAKSQGIKGYSKMKKNDLVEVLSNMA
ncbi:SAP-like protein BP-73 [Oryza brachyantha]|nr:SAP-like protein BP-73 [Oryza brachyantha]